MIRNAKTNLIQFVLYLFLNPLPSDRLHCILPFHHFGAYSHIVLYNLSAYRLLIPLCQIKIMNIHFSRCHRLLLPFGFVAAYFVEFVRDVQFVACYVVLIFSLFFLLFVALLFRRFARSLLGISHSCGWCRLYNPWFFAVDGCFFPS